MKTVRAKLLTTVFSGLALVLMSAMFAINSVKYIAQEYDVLIQEELSAQLKVNLILNTFKTQVQEWKNILIRGENPEQFDKYFKQFEEQEAFVQQSTSELMSGSYLPKSILMQLNNFKGEHKKLGELYRIGLSEFKNANYNTQDGDKAVKGIDRAAAKHLKELNQSIDQYVESAVSRLRAEKEVAIFESTVITLTVSFIVIVTMALLIQRWITRPIKLASQVATEISNGNLENRISSTSKDEIGALLTSLDKMQTNIRQANEQLTQQMLQQKLQAEESGRIKQALDNASSPVLLYKETNEIIYANNQTNELFNRYQSLINSPPKLTGANIIQILSSDYEEHLEQAKNKQVQFEMNIDHVYMNITASPVLNDENNVIGVVVELIDLTEQRNTENKVDDIINSAVSGQLDARLDVHNLNGFMLTLSKGINRLLDAIVSPVQQTEKYLTAISRGEIPDKIEGNYSGDFLKIKQSLEQSSKAINLLISDSKFLVDSALAGQLSHRADSDAHNGEFKSIITGINQTLDAIIQPVQLTSQYLDSIAIGQLPSVDKTQFNGDFEKILTSFETSIQAINLLLNDTSMLASAANSGELSKRANIELHQGAYKVIVSSINDTLDAISTPLQSCIAVMNALEHGDLTKKIEGNYSGDFANLKDSVNQSIENLASMVTEINDTANTVAKASAQISQSTQDLNSSTESQAASIEETTVSMGEVTDKVTSNTKHAQTANEHAQNADKQAIEGGTLVNNTVIAMKAISDSSNEISNIIEVINGIAFQTNLLALNAAVEAARAGEKGRGFAVVAAEVRQLAQRSSDAAKEISGLLKDSADKVDNGLMLAEQSGNTLRHIVSSIQTLSKLMNDIALSSNEQSNGVSQINIAIKQIDQSVQQNNSLVEQTSHAGASLDKQASHLRALVSQFTV
ncbi:methyl-accepting chemotaxis protein [Pseudoalteromonas phenolica]|uniref:methyl-accepting chemotaxis protein n=1 Tax=Pseudoalteromonas phenolica TaxID=161398 RepID=UPI00127867F0|nr:methyl-accepting chemotaxis protein [Pseudoalteromonas phenolica]TMO55239.1 diguanylate cyclase [Pseudoalteromonas phenolica]